jgi:zinc transport system permease protein
VGLNLDLFLIPLATGCLYALMLALLGALLRLQDEWWMALGLPYLAAATGLGGLAAGIPVGLAAPLGALGGAGLRRLWDSRGNSGYAFMILVGWAATELIPASSHLDSGMARALVAGQVLIAGQVELSVAGLVLLANLMALPWLMPRLLRARFLPSQLRANQAPVALWHLGFAALAALTLAEATLSLGVIGTFALTVVPPWIGFRLAWSWRWTLILGAAFGLVAWLGAFTLALSLEQPIGPLVAAVLVVLAGLAALLGPGRG